MERQGLVGDLNSKTKEELCDILNRQEKILQNKRFIQTLPDKGKKILDFVEKVRQALAKKEADQKKQASLASVRAGFQSRYQQAFTRRQHRASDIVSVSGSTREDDGGSLDDENAEGSGIAATPMDGDLVTALGQISLSTDAEIPIQSTSHQNKSHYVEVLSKSEECVQKHRFKPNTVQLKSTSPIQSSDSGSLLSAEARQQRDRKHLDDITAAKLPPLHHNPAQLLSLKESVALQQEQTKKYQELQAKQAAQRLAEGLTAGTSGDSPDEGALAAYSEVPDDGELSDVD